MEEDNTKIEQLRDSIKNLYSDMKESFNNALKGYSDFRVYDTHCFFNGMAVKFAIFLNEDNDEIAKWNTIELVLEEVDILEGNNDIKFTSNIGTTGEFDLDDNSKGSRTNFYIQVGKLLGNQNIMDIIKNGMIVYGTAIRENRDKLKELRNKIEN